MLRDEMRIAAYEAALRRAVTPESRVLEIGVPGQKIRIFGAHDRQRLTIWSETRR